VQALTVHTGTVLPLRRSDVDTDQITPARFVPYLSLQGFANALFADWRRDPEFPLNRPEHQGATILVAGSDFGTGSSRESAVWALQLAGFRVVLAPRFGDIFRANALSRGLLAVEIPAELVERLWARTEADCFGTVTVDLEQQEVRFADVVQPFSVEPGARERILRGLDPIGETLTHDPDITRYEAAARRSALPVTTAPSIP
jgi:3-isopropylmalate/(R)-2-methylmalate dehydratase small subunit